MSTPEPIEVGEPMARDRRMQWRKADGTLGVYEGPLLYLGRGIPRPMRDHGVRRAVFDLAFGYVSGFPVRDVLAFSVRSLWPSPVLDAIVEPYTEDDQP